MRKTQTLWRALWLCIDNLILSTLLCGYSSYMANSNLQMKLMWSTGINLLMMIALITGASDSQRLHLGSLRIILEITHPEANWEIAEPTFSIFISFLLLSLNSLESGEPHLNQQVAGSEFECHYFLNCPSSFWGIINDMLKKMWELHYTQV